jgi:Fatty acid hydroxylase superfamily
LSLDEVLDAVIRAKAVSRGRHIKRMNAVVAVVSGTIPAGTLGLLYPNTPAHWLLGFLIGLVWANGFEYAYHRFLLHKAGTLFARNHLVHHASVGSLTEAEDLNLGSSPAWVALLFMVNGVPVVTLDLLFAMGTSPGTLLGFVVYMLLVEELHWRIHLGERLPPGLGFARKHHFMHHDRPNSRYNIFFPLSDFAFGSLAPEDSSSCRWQKPAT